MHSADVLHCDLKPGNLHVNRNCDLKIYDFGMARLASGVRVEPESESLEAYVRCSRSLAPALPLQCYFPRSSSLTPDCRMSQTAPAVMRWYRPAELSLTRIDMWSAVDMWSAGCILGEMLLRKPIFPGQNEFDQIKVILSKVGSPSEDDQAFIMNKKSRDL